MDNNNNINNSNNNNNISNNNINPIRPGLFWSSWAWGGGASKAPPLHKSESIDAIDMKLGG